MIVDSHCHLNYFSQEERDKVIADAKANDVGIMQTICTTISEFADLLKIAHSCVQVYTSVGVHPSNAATGEYISTEDLIKLTTDEKVIGIGETGLDFYKQGNTEKQIKSFLAHIEAARETGLPLIIHSRAADEEMINVLESEMKKDPFTAVMHCFASSDKLAQKAIELGFYISFSGIITFKNAEVIRDIATSIPYERVLVETDSPYLSPEPHRGKKNEPAMTKYVVDYLAKLWSKSSQEVEAITTNNFFKLFTKVKIEKVE
ncbi:TatD family hydrolase [Candidatus Mesenet endosymbiont of Agriotes lineatus]|uniref:TatD family hydrolase n=1 Tax=Candidatus Mesenet endosymbiont of Agriotes lineatus TaxID=3077948 RepID=UPI0030CBF328